jgi:hypothetical protein
MNFLYTNFENEEAILQSFDRIADKISRDIVFRVNRSDYRIVDFEFYCYGKSFKDPFTHKSESQLQNGKIYLHGSGIDVTFGDGNNYGGILIRGVIKLGDGSGIEEGHMKKQFDGPHNVATELFTGLHSLVEPQNMNDIRLQDIDGYHADSMYLPPIALLKTKRVNLVNKSDDPEDKFLNLPLRYIVVLKKFPKFKQSLRGMEAVVGDHVKSGKLTTDQASEILGYNRNF